MANEGIISGYKDGSFGVDDGLKRSQIAKILTDAYGFGEKPLTNNKFSDVNKDAYYAPYLPELIDNEITFGKSETSFAPDELVNRGQMAMFLFRSDAAKFGTYVNTQITKIEKGTVYTSAGKYGVSEDLKGFFSQDNAKALNGSNIVFRVVDGKVSAVEQIELNSMGTSSNTVTFNGGAADIKGNLIVQGDHLKVGDVTINGNLVIAEKAQHIFEGADFEVKGTTIIADSTSEATVASTMKKTSMSFNQVKLNDLKVVKKDARISFENNSSVENVQLSQNVVIDAEDNSKIKTIQITGDVTEVEINADVEKVEVNTTKKVTLNATGKIDTLELAAEVEIELSEEAKIGHLKLS